MSRGRPDDPHREVRALATAIEGLKLEAQTRAFAHRCVDGSAAARPDDAMQIATAAGLEMALLLRQRRLLQRADELRSWAWDHPELERENYYRAREAISGWPSRRALLADLLVGERRAIEHLELADAAGQARAQTLGFGIVALVAAYFAVLDRDPAAALLTPVAAGLATFALRRAMPRYASAARGESETWRARLDAAFLAGAEGAQAGRVPDVDAWLAEVEPAFAMA